MKIVILCVNYHCADVIFTMLDSIPQVARKSIDVVITDNSSELSKDDSVWQIADFASLNIVSPGQNLGYFGGARAGLLAAKNTETVDLVMIVNPDIVFDASFFDDLAQACDTVSQDIGVIFPSVIESTTGQDSNPFLRTRPAVSFLDTRIYFFSSRLRFLMWNLLSRLKSKLRAMKVKPAFVAPPGPVYAGHGALLIFRKNYFARGGSLNFDSFLYAEELFVAETCLEIGLKGYHATNVRCKHVGQVSTGKLPSERRRMWQLESLRYVRARYFI